MNLSEFKAWFEGFTECMEGTPTKKQWERIKERVAKIDGTPVTYPIYIRDYWQPYYSERDRWYLTSIAPISTSGTITVFNGTSETKIANVPTDWDGTWNSQVAMHSLGVEDYNQLATHCGTNLS